MALFFVALVTWSHISLRTVLLAVYPIVMLFVFSLGVGLILSTMYVFVRDIMHIWEVFCTLLVYGSAIFYDPSQMASWMQAVINLNPIYWYITAVRSCVMWGTGLTLNMVLIPFLCSALSLGIGVYVFKGTRTNLSCICKGLQDERTKATAHYFHRPCFDAF